MITEKTIYITEDGKKFLSRKAAEKHEDDNDNVKCKCSVCEAQDEMSKKAFDNNEVHYCWRCGSYMI